MSSPYPLLQGTVACPTCKGNPKVRRLTPDFAQALSLGPLWDEVIMARCGRWYFGLENRPEDKRRLFLEYPSGGRSGAGAWEQLAAVHFDRGQLTLDLRADACPLLPSRSPSTAAVERPIELPAPRPFIAEQTPPKPDDPPGLGSKPSGWASRALNVEDYVTNYASGGWPAGLPCCPCTGVLHALVVGGSRTRRTPS